VTVVAASGARANSNGIRRTIGAVVQILPALSFGQDRQIPSPLVHEMADDTQREASVPLLRLWPPLLERATRQALAFVRRVAAKRETEVTCDRPAASTCR
jgi:hypothetical protein